jgi:deoxyribodipyrimidine photo-lyase
VIYWMRRDHRARDNWALSHAQAVAQQQRVPFGVLFCLTPQFLGACQRQYGFMLTGLQEVAADLAKRGIPFFLVTGQPGRQVPAFVREHGVSLLVVDFSPLRLVRQWDDEVTRRLRIPIHQIDTHNIVPCWEASPKQEYAARTLRPKLQRRLAEFLDPLPRLRRHPFPWRARVAAPNWRKAAAALRFKNEVGEVDWLQPGPRAALRTLRAFIRRRLRLYEPGRNDPNQAAQSDLSPYLHFGHISAQRVVAEVLQWSENLACREAFLEQLIVRKELADNFCYYNENYDSVAGFPAWARKTLHAHAGDARPHLYPAEQLAVARTHDALWNAGQIEMVTRGKMHGYLRMYWAKKILEWTASPEEALQIAIDLNDTYELDGRDPNGYVGIAWSIGGVHDRPWFERPVFGTVRYMSLGGCRSKFDVDRYIASVQKQRASRGKTA